jgi:hypothetical protein
VLVITESGEFKGKVPASSESSINDDKEILIESPIQIYRDQEGNVVKEKPMGKRIL